MGLFNIITAIFVEATLSGTQSGRHLWATQTVGAGTAPNLSTFRVVRIGMTKRLWIEGLCLTHFFLIPQTNMDYTSFLLQCRGQYEWSCLGMD